MVVPADVNGGWQAPPSNTALHANPENHFLRLLISPIFPSFASVGVRPAAPTDCQDEREADGGQCSVQEQTA